MGHKLTREDIKKMEKEIQYRISEVRPKALEDVKEARAQGDLSENFEYHAAKRFKNQNESRIRYLQRTIANASILEDSAADDEVGINKIVGVYYDEDEEEDEFHIVTAMRADDLNNYITIESPLGRAMMGHKAGDSIVVHVNDKISYPLTIRYVKPYDESEDKIKSY